MSKKTIALFPGQGSQNVGMMKELFENFRVVREAFEEGSDSTGLHLKKLCFEGPEDELTLTENTQPALLVSSVAAFRVAQAELGYTPELVAGHSLGEYSALVAAGALPLAAAARWVRERGAAMQKAVPAGQGGMVAVMGMEDEAIYELCKRAVSIATDARASGAYENLVVDCVAQPANFNAPGQTVIAGSKDAMTEAMTLIKSGDFGKAKGIELAVSAPFHCKLMGTARLKMADLFKKATESERPFQLNCAYIPNRTARITAEPSAVFELLIDQVDNSVLWRQSVTTMMSEGFENTVEFGPGKVLQGLCKRIATAANLPLNSSGLNDLASLNALKEFLK